MHINPLKIEEPTANGSPSKANAFMWRLVALVVLALLVGIFLFFKVWLNLSAIKDWPTVS